MDIRKLVAAILIICAHAELFYRPIFAEYSAMPQAASGDNGAAETAPAEWQEIYSAYFNIYYRPDSDLKAIERRLRRRYFFIGKSYLKGRDDSYMDKIAYRVDILCRRVEDILGMYPRKLRVNIKIFRDGEELADEYEKIFNKREYLKSFYVFKYNTIYTTEKDISDSVLAHEIGHAVIDHYFVVKPPEKIAELLATYVDEHLEEE